MLSPLICVQWEGMASVEETLTLTAVRDGNDVELTITAGDVTQRHIVHAHNLCPRIEPFLQNALARICKRLERPLKQGAA